MIDERPVSQFYYFFLLRQPQRSTLFPYTTLFRSWNFVCTEQHPFQRMTRARSRSSRVRISNRSEEHTSELQSPDHLVCRLLLEKKDKMPARCSSACSTRASWTHSIPTAHLILSAF